jgi:hypothetical protein
VIRILIADLSAAAGPQRFLTSFSLGRTGSNLTDLYGDGPAAPGGILHGERVV